ncbi:major facilitator superfamily domain-containing protein [Lipomyces arxii]|uniref:major facilitator superfamily domain-containing protein n=1 Tax=Lipomyces arxii TaxID=56418 RepID=UPI0034CDE224
MNNDARAIETVISAYTAADIVEETTQRREIETQETEFKPNLFKRILAVVWDCANKSPEERALVNKLDVGILIYVILSFTMQVIDTANVSNAYVSGMQDDLQLYGNELNYFSTALYIGYLVGSVPSQFVLYKVRPSVWIPTCNLAWSICVFCLAAVKNAWGIYIIRFIIGLTEAVCYPAFAMLIGSWYKPDELAKRMVLYDASWAIGNICSGYIQAGVYSSMNGLHGLPGWKWQFIVDGLISAPVAILGFYALPDFPSTTRAFWLKPQHRELAISRMQDVGRKGPQRMTRQRFFAIFKKFNVYPFLLTYSIYLTNGSNYMNLWLDSLGTFSVEMVNILPTIGYAIAFIGAFIYAVVSDYTRWRWQCLLVAISFSLIGNVMLAIWEIPYGAKFFAYLLPNFGSPVWGLLLTWSTEMFQDDTELRGMLPALGNTLWYGFTAFVPILVFPMQYAPRFLVGYWVSSAFLITMAIGVVTMVIGNKIEVKRRGLVLNKYGLAVEKEDLESAMFVVSSERSVGSVYVEESERVTVKAGEKD